MRELSSRHHRGRPAKKAKPWYQKGPGAARLARDKIIVSEYPTLAYVTEEETAVLSLEGTFAYDSQSGICDEINVRIVFPPIYPNQEPRAYDADNYFPHTLERHFYNDGFADGRCCLWLPPKSKWNADDPEGLRMFLDELALFFERELIFDATGKWPGSEYDHGSNGYLQWIKEILEVDDHLIEAFTSVLGKSTKIGRNDPCPCGASQKYKKCHLSKIEHICQRVDLRILHKMFPTH